MNVLHRCDNRRCVRPDHLFLGTFKDNTQDMMKKGRNRGGCPPGELAPSAKLTAEKVRMIRQSHQSGVIVSRLAKEYGITSQSVNAIVKRKSWRHIA
jgi:DNA invertase Pin-like site-specific DNA recombinase